jgi:hypothetical protein
MPVHVQGNRLVNVLGLPVTLHGANRGDSPDACIKGYGVFETGAPYDQGTVQALKTWRINALRISLNEDCWLGINGAPASTSGPIFQQTFKDYVNLLNQNGIYVILDLHWSAPGTIRATGQQPMPDADHSTTMWSQVATAFKGNDAVIFDLFNEPWPNNQAFDAAAWTCWRDGSASGTCSGFSYSAVGSQTLVNAVRATGATNVLMIAGVGYGNALGSWLTYKPVDPLNNLAASWHDYNFNVCKTVACWDANVAPVAAQVPVVTGEIGVSNCDATFFNMLMNWLDAHQTSYLAWTWNTWGPACNTSALITDAYAATPTQYGQIYKTHLAALP